MRCGSCGQRNRKGATFCDACGQKIRLLPARASSSTIRDCVSCGKKMDLGVYYTMCPHCGFNYRIEVTPVIRGLGTSKRNVAALYALSAAVPVAGFVVGALLSSEMDKDSRRLSSGCVALAALNIIITPILIMRFFGLA